MKTTTKWIAISSIAFAGFIAGCKKPNTTNPGTASGYDNGVFITCEGAFGSGSGTVSFYNKNTGIVSNDIFQLANNFPLGNLVQSMSLHNNKAYVIVNNSNKVEVANAADFKSIATITGVNFPRYFLGVDNTKAYVTEWGSSGLNGSVKVINLLNNTVSATINTGKGAERMLQSGNNVYVTCKGGYDNDSLVTVINTMADSVIATINVGPNPDGIQVDANGKIWILCGGRWDGTFSSLTETGQLVRIDPSTNLIEQTFVFASTTSTPANLCINAAKNKLYYSYQGSVYTQDITSSTLNSSAIINRNFYSLAIDPTDDYIYASDAGNYTSNGKVIRFNTTGSKVDSFQVGVIPGGFAFR